MIAGAILIVVVPILLVLAIVLIVAAVRRSSAIGDKPGPRLASVRGRTTRWRWGGVLVGILLAGASVQLGDPLGRGLMLAAPLFSIAVLGGVVIGELRVSAPAGRTRQATVEVRRVRDYVPRRLAVCVTTAAGLLLVVLSFTTALGSPDDLGHAGRRLIWACGEAMTQGRGPWPGSFYSTPLAILVLGGLGAAAFAVHRVVWRPRQGEDRAFDDAFRIHSAAAVTAATGILVAIPLGGVSTFASIALLGIACPPRWMTTVGWSLAMLAPLSLALVTWCAAVLVSPSNLATRRPVR